MNFYTQKDHEILAKNVDLIDKKWLVSYDNTEFIVSLYKEHRKVLYRLSQAASNRIGDEIIIFSNRLSFNESMEKLKDSVQI
jgi:DNA adenine methylase